MTKTLALVALALGIAGAPALAYADDACMTQAMGKKLAGAAKTSFTKKCVEDSVAKNAGAACEAQAAEKKLAGAAKTSFTKKCIADAGA